MSNLDKLKELEDKRQGVFGMMAGSTHPRTGKLITAEKETLRLIELVNDYGEVLEQLKAAQAQLDALAKQEPLYEMFAVHGWMQVSKEHYENADKTTGRFREVFTRAAPVVLVKLPDDETLRDLIRTWNRAPTPKDAWPAMREVLRLNNAGVSDE